MKGNMKYLSQAAVKGLCNDIASRISRHETISGNLGLFDRTS
jgi:hypothetical protein